MNIETQLIHAGNTTDAATGSVNVPIYQTSTYAQVSLTENNGYLYARADNPTRHALERLIAELEEGHKGFAFASGLAAINSVLALFGQGDTILTSDNLYGGTYRMFHQVYSRFGLNVNVVDTTDIEAVRAAFEVSNSIRAIYIESPSNPLLDVSDIEAIAKIAHQHDALLIVDNTFMSPYLQKPLNLGADIVLHSATKYLSGHSDLLAGLVVTKSEALSEQIAFLQNSLGGILSPNDSFLLIRGIKTLAVRLDRTLVNTQLFLDYLRQSKQVKQLYHPTLPSHPNHGIFLKQTKGNIGLISFELTSDVNIDQFLSGLSIITLAVSLGGVESLICNPASTTHAVYPEEERNRIGLANHLLRISIGIEYGEDLVEDFDQALQQAIIK
ncbi:trans-sulfuration enzyme family protein [Fundicoccus ignavus]|uniref:Aminotransferase class I/II-fold pyridoxal phosphate-dependent enzyme n=1 Tax=Fundicoccus ignavus TaxID=2664442 RepID=A0A844C649_9LACT|nr:PLP-dependent aspartate aminotransferase family protein [Fundicoccus ignavus]MRJ45977.1 aminotransferase class I/II-fold pyridoxal phosphate-dependent enzyme [Fundicoccus ignavus]